MAHANRDAAANPRRAQVEMLAGHAPGYLLPVARKDARRADQASQAGLVRPLADRDGEIDGAEVLNLVRLALMVVAFVSLMELIPCP